MSSATEELRMSFELEEDIENEIHNFVRLERLCEYEEAHEAFNTTLLKHVSFFPVIAEYANLLWAQNKYRMLSDFLDIQLECLGDKLLDTELHLLRMLKALARIHTHGALVPAINQAELTFEFLSSHNNVRSGTLPGDVEIHIFEVYMHIVAFAVTTSNLVDFRQVKCPWIPRNTTCHPLVEWYNLLAHSLLWEASKVLCVLLSILPVIPAQDVLQLFNHRCFGHVPSLNASSWLGLGQLEHLIAFNVSLSRTQALANLALMLQIQDPLISTWVSPFLRAKEYHDFAMSLSRRFSSSSLQTYRVEIQRTEFELVRQLLFHIEPTLKHRRCYLLPDPRKDSCSYLSHAILRMVSVLQGHSDYDPTQNVSLFDLSVFQVEQLGDKTAFIQTWDAYCALLRQLTNTGTKSNREARPSSELWPYLALLGFPYRSSYVEQLKKEITDVWAMLTNSTQYQGPKVSVKLRSVIQEFREILSGVLDIPSYVHAIASNETYLNLEGDSLGVGYDEEEMEAAKCCFPRDINLEEIASTFKAVSIKSKRPILRWRT